MYVTAERKRKNTKTNQLEIKFINYMIANKRTVNNKK